MDVVLAPDLPHCGWGRWDSGPSLPRQRGRALVRRRCPRQCRRLHHLDLPAGIVHVPLLAFRLKDHWAPRRRRRRRILGVLLRECGGEVE